MKALFCLFICAFFIGCYTQAQNTSNNTTERVKSESTLNSISNKESSIRNVDFRNFTFPWKNSLLDNVNSFTLANGEKDFGNGLDLSLQSVAYVSVANEYEDPQALVTIDVGDGNSTNEILFVYAWENNKPKLLQIFEFNDGITDLTSVFAAHGELVLITYELASGDSYCCPSVIKISNYKWQKDKFVLQGEPQKVPNEYVERVKKMRKS